MRLTILLLLITITLGAAENQQPTMLPEVVIVAKPYEEILREVFRENEISPAMIEILIAQAKHETGNFKSRLFVYHNNCYGFQHPSKRSTTSLGPYARAEGREGYASYASVEDSAMDMVLYLRARNIPDYTSVTRYVKHLKRKGYFEDDVNRYIKSVRSYV